ncbi:MAG TPA: restriction endonuclease subunit S [Prolixibacteraceae bacterium]
MPENWKTYKLGDVADVQNGFAFKSTELGEKGIPVIKIKNIVSPNVILEGAEYYTGEIDTKHEKYILQRNDFLLSMTGSTVNVMSSAVGKMGKYRLDDIALINQRVGKIYITDTKKADFDYVCHFLNRYEINYNLALNATGSANQANISPAQIKDIDILLPPLPEQIAIATILSTIDDKIELNLQMNKTLEEMAMTLYKHWFVDFGPFREGEFVDSELGKIPKGWEVKRLEDIVTSLSKGTTPRQSDVDGLNVEIPFLKVKDVNDDGSIKYAGIEYIPKTIHDNQLKRSILETDDILFSIAGTIGRVSIVPEKLDNSNCNQALAFIRLKDKNGHLPLIYYWLKSESTQREINSLIVQGVQANVSLTVLKDLRLVLADSKNMILFNVEMNPILSLIFECRTENQTLTTLRDTLLPKLISGEVRLKEFAQT